MHTKAPMSHPPKRDDSLSPVIEAYFQFQHLKQLFRQGWLRRGVGPEHAESVADHSFGAALLAMLLADQLRPDLDVGRVMRLALIHDLGEAHAGDLTPEDGVSAGEKRAREREGVQRILGGLPGEDRYLELWEEYEQSSSPEAAFVRRVDRLEMALQATVYETQGHGDLGEFLATARRDIGGSELAGLMDELDRIHDDHGQGPTV